MYVMVASAPTENTIFILFSLPDMDWSCPIGEPFLCPSGWDGPAPAVHLNFDDLKCFALLSGTTFNADNGKV